MMKSGGRCVAWSTLVWLLTACTGAEGGSGGAGGWQATVDTVGDTITVRTVAGSVWGGTAHLEEEMRIGVFEGPDEYMLGRVRSMAVTDAGEIYLFDSQVPALRKYGSDGTHLATFGREGGGPGEYENPDGGLGVLPDGRVVLRDPGNTRFSVYAPTGEYLTNWRLPGGFNSSNPLHVDTAGTSYTLVLLERGLAPWDWTFGLATYAPDGTPGDTVLAPTWDYERPTVRGQSENSSSQTGVPFTADDAWTFSPLGYMVGGVATDYRVNLYRTDEPVLRIERDWTPVPVNPEEGEEQERRIRENFSRRFPGWRWNGPPIPETKPAFVGLFVGLDGRVWVQVSAESYPTMSVEEAREEERRTDRPQMRYRQRVAFDVFEPDGRYLGHVMTPDGFTTSPDPVFSGDHVWAVTTGELDMPTVVRYRIERPTT